MSSGFSDEDSRLRLLYDLGCAFAGRIEIDELIPLVMSKVREVLDAEGASVLLLDELKQELYFPYVVSERQDVAARLAGLRLPANRGIAGAALQTGRPIRVDDVHADPRFYPGIDRATGSSTHSVLAAPLIARRGTIGVLQVVNRHGGSFDDADLGFLEALAGSVAVAIENAQLYARLKESEEGLRAQVGALRRDLARREGFADIIGRSASMMAVFSLMESAAGSPITVLIEGETGTGKELVARGIHRASSRAEGPFLAVNCAALPETLLESELFGHRRGSFTGAIHDQRGLFEAAAGGTVLLDEIGEMPPAMQAKLLRVLQEGEVVPLGDTRPRRIDVRVIAATNRELRAEVDERRFREDLYYRIAAFPIRLPPLSDRREDIPLLADRFLAGAAARNGKQHRGLRARGARADRGIRLARQRARAAERDRARRRPRTRRRADRPGAPVEQARRHPRDGRRLTAGRDRSSAGPGAAPGARRLGGAASRLRPAAPQRQRVARRPRPRHLALHAAAEDEGLRAPRARGDPGP